MTTVAYVPLSEYLSEELWPAGFLAPGSAGFLDDLAWVDGDLAGTDESIYASLRLMVMREVVFDLPAGIAVVVGSGEVHATFEAGEEEGWHARLAAEVVKLRLPRALFRPVIERDGVYEVDPDPNEHVDIAIPFALTLDSAGNFDVEWPGEGESLLDLPPCMIGDSGIVVEASDVGLRLSTEAPLPEAAFAAGLPDDWTGLHFDEAAVHLPEGLGDAVPDDVRLTDCFIGTGGFTGSVALDWTPAFSGTLFGVTFGLAHFGLSFRENAITASAIRGQLTLPFFDEPVSVTVGIELGGRFTVAVEGTGSSGLYTLSKAGVCDLTLDSLGFEVDQGTFLARLSGRLTPTLGAPGLSWPTVTVRDLTIDSHGNVRVDGGWLDLDRGYTLDLYGFRLEITRLGFGKTDDGGTWIGLNGGLKLVEGMAAGASVEGLRITWYPGGGRPPALTLEGVEVEFTVPEVLRFRGEVSYREYLRGGATIHRFDGAIRVELLALGFEVDGELVVGVADRGSGPEPFMAVYLAAELPAGIPLWSTGLGLFGMAGLFAVQMEPDKTPAEKWYALGEPDWFHRGTPGVTDLDKWDFTPGSFALGAGVTIGTVADNGFTFNGRFLLVLVFPGPVIMLEGRANILRERSTLSSEPIFHALAVLDARRGEFTFGLDARYRYGAGGELIDIGGGVEAYFSLADARAWHLYLGMEEPREKRIRAQILKLFEANAYLMVDADSLRTGAWVGYDRRWTFGPLRVVVEAWAEGKANISWNPAHFTGSLWLHGLAELSVFGFGASLGVDARLTAEVFDPFHVVGEFSVSIGLPWPLPDFDVDIRLEWGPERVWPPLPLPLKEVAVEHLKSTASWPLRRASAAGGGTALLRPDYDAGGGVRVTSEPPAPPQAPPADAPVVPLDARPRLTFARPVHDEALAGGNPQPPNPAVEIVGDPAGGQGAVSVRYELREVALERWTGTTWDSVARAAAGDATKTLFGSWAPVPGSGGAVAQTKLWLWSRNPFDWTRRTSRAWDEWFTPNNPGYPCPPEVPGTDRCWSFAEEKHRGQVEPGWQHEDGGPGYTWPAHAPAIINDEEQPAEGLRVALCAYPPMVVARAERTTSLGAGVTVNLPVGSNAGVRMVVRSPLGVRASVRDAQGAWHGPFTGGTPDDPTLDLPVVDAVVVQIIAVAHVCVFEVCILGAESRVDSARRAAMTSHLVTSLERWSATGYVLLPYQQYRLLVVTRLTATPVAGGGLGGDPTRSHNQTEYAYFRTEGPPRLANLSLPAGTTATDDNTLRGPTGADVDVDGGPSARPVLRSELNDLAPYVEQTLPPTVAPPGEQPVLPRPVYRAYDAGVAFNEDYVDLLYRLAGRALTLVLFDVNNRPARDAFGRLVVANGWDRSTSDPLVDESTARWVATVNASTCASLDVTTTSRPVVVGAGGFVLRADTVHEARLVPLLMHETFASYGAGTAVVGPSGRLGLWAVVDQTATGAPSRWEVVSDAGTPPSYAVVQRSNIGGGAATRNDPAKPGTLLVRVDDPALPVGHRDSAAAWTDYRLTVTVRAADDDAVGVVFRCRDASNTYRFSMDRERSYRRLVRVVGGVVTVLAEDDVAYRPNQDMVVVVEAIGSSIRVHVDGEPVFDVEDPTFPAGSVGLYAWASVDARFSEVRVDDFREAAPVAYRFRFTTSRYVDFLHQLHSYDDATWRLRLAADVGAQLAAAVALPTAPTAPAESEVRGFDALVAAAPEVAAALRTPTDKVDVTRVEAADGTALAFLLRSPEPVDWRRTTVELQRAAATSRPRPAGVAKIVALARGATPADESVTVLARGDAVPTGWRVERLALPGPLQGDAVGRPLLADRFGARRGVLFVEEFGPNALDRYTIVDAPGGVSSWTSTATYLQESSNVYTGPFTAAALAKPGTVAVTGDPGWTDVRVIAVLRPMDDDEVGVVFRYREGGCYRFSMNRQFGYRRLVRLGPAGAATLLWEDAVAYDVGRAYTVELVAWRDQLLGWVDNSLLFSLTDATHPAGQVGFSSWANTPARFEGLRVESVETSPVLWQVGFPPSLADLRAADDAGAAGGPSSWSATPTTLVESSGITGTQLVTKGRGYSDLDLHAEIDLPAAGRAGVLVRYRDPANFYRLSIDAAGSRRLERSVAGTVTVLHDSTGPAPAASTPRRVVLKANGDRLVGVVDGSTVFDVRDSAHGSGDLGVVATGAAGVAFRSVTATDPTRRVGRWDVLDGSDAGGPSSWTTGRGAISQRARVAGGDASATSPDKPGTVAVTGDQSWTDYRFSAVVRADDEDAVGVVFRYTGPKDWYRLSFDSRRSRRALVRCQAGTLTTLWSASAASTPGIPLDVSVVCAGDRLVGSLGGVRLFDLRDNAHPSGRVGLYCWAARARFEDVAVTTVPLDALALFRDRFASAGTAGWTFTDEGTVGAPSSWLTSGSWLRQISPISSATPAPLSPRKAGTSATAGDVAWTDYALRARVRSDGGGAIGVCFRHRDGDNWYRFVMDRTRSYRQLVRSVAGNLEVLWQDEVPYDAGRVYDVTIVVRGRDLRGFVDGIPAFAVSDDSHLNGKIGFWCWADPAARFSEVRVYPASVAPVRGVFGPARTLGTPGAWQVVDSGAVDGPSQWEAFEQGLRQMSNIRDIEPRGAPDKQGTVAVAGRDLDDFRFSIRMRTDGDNDAIGVVFRYRDAGNCYRFSMDADRGYRRLVKVAGGAITTLWEDVTFGYLRERDYLVTVECVGDRIRAYVDGALGPSVRDATHVSGRVGLYCFANDDARFLDAELTQPEWFGHAVIRHASLLTAGGRVRLVSGGVPTSAPGEVAESIAGPGEPGALWFPTDEAADLRLLDAGGQEMHRRRFLPDADMAVVGCRLLRNPDGTAFFLVPDAPFAPGTYELRLRYRRDIGSAGPRLSRAGDASDEHVRLSIPWVAAME